LLTSGISYTLCELPSSWIPEGEKAGGRGRGLGVEKGTLETKKKIDASP